EDLFVLYRILDVHETADAKSLAKCFGVLADLVQYGWRQGSGGNHAGAIATVDTGFFDVLHDTGDNAHAAGFLTGIGAFRREIADGIDVNFNGAIQEFIDENRMLRRHVSSNLHEASDLVVVVDDLHGPATEDVAGANHNRVTN